MLIKITGLEKRFGKLQVLKKIDVTIEPKRITAILGPNGSGKTTLIKAILGLIRVNAGKICIDDHCLTGDWAYRHQIGYMPQIGRYPENLTTSEVFALIKDVRPGHENLDEELLHRFQLTNEMNKPMRTLSGGTKQKVSAAIAFLFRPAILILDEPTAGLDPASSGILKVKIVHEKEQGRTILLTSHIMSEVEQVADHIVYLYEGRIIYDGSLEHLIRQTGETTLERAIARLIQA